MAMSGNAELMAEKVQQLRAVLSAAIEARGLVSDWDDEPSSYL